MSDVQANLRALSATHALPQTHTPAGGYQLVLVILLIVLIGLTGWLQDLDAFWGEDWPQDLHEYFANALIILATIHVLTVMWMQFGLNIPLLQRMGFGRSED